MIARSQNESRNVSAVYRRNLWTNHPVPALAMSEWVHLDTRRCFTARLSLPGEVPRRGVFGGAVLWRNRCVFLAPLWRPDSSAPRSRAVSLDCAVHVGRFLN